MTKILVAVTGASAMLCVQSFLEMLDRENNVTVHGICSEAGEKVLELEHRYRCRRQYCNKRHR